VQKIRLVDEIHHQIGQSAEVYQAKNDAAGIEGQAGLNRHNFSTD